MYDFFLVFRFFAEYLFTSRGTPVLRGT